MDHIEQQDNSSPTAEEVRMHIKLPARVSRRGRPKGVEKTVVGLPSKRRRLTTLVPFSRRHCMDREKIIVMVCGKYSDRKSPER